MIMMMADQSLTSGKSCDASRGIPFPVDVNSRCEGRVEYYITDELEINSEYFHVDFCLYCCFTNIRLKNNS